MSRVNSFTINSSDYSLAISPCKSCKKSEKFQLIFNSSWPPILMSYLLSTFLSSHRIRRWESIKNYFIQVLLTTSYILTPNLSYTQNQLLQLYINNRSFILPGHEIREDKALLKVTLREYFNESWYFIIIIIIW